MKKLTKLLSFAMCAMLLVGCGNKATSNTTKATNNNTTTVSKDIKTTDNKGNGNESQKNSTSKLPEGFSNEKFVEDSKQILSLIKDFCDSKTIVSKDKVSVMSAYVKTYSNKNPDVLNQKERNSFEQVKQLLVYYSQYENYAKQKSQENMDNILKQTQSSYDEVKVIFIK